MHYGARAKDWITDHDVKQKTLAQEFHVTEPMLSNCLTGRNDMPVDLLVKLARHFGITTDYLVGLTDIPEPPLYLSSEERALVECSRALSKEQRDLLSQIAHLMWKQNQR